MKPAALFAMTHLSITQLETSHRLTAAELERSTAASRRAAARPRSARRLFRAVRGAAAA